jgi:hypothetical protein
MDEDKGKKGEKNIWFFGIYIGLLVLCVFYAAFGPRDPEVIPVAVICAVMAVWHLARAKGRLK